MGYYTALVTADSPLITYYPGVGFDPSQYWVTTYIPTTYPLLYYSTSASVASVEFDFYGDEFGLSAPGEPGCDYTISINGAFQNQSFHESFDLPLGQYHVELDVSCSEGQSMAFEGVIFAENQGPDDLEDETVYLTPENINAVGHWKETFVYSEYFLMNFTQYQTLTPGSTLSYTFQGVQTEIVGSVGPDGGNFYVTLDGQRSKTLTAYRPVYDDDVTLWVEQFLNEGETHTLTVTNLGRNLTILQMNYDVLVPSTGG
ncbi:hypothetical protein CALVIDRAFT_59756 [Calocera viscosa TUFC12733]|uniref:Uncharacterized protein n=1 Tax=Calocera viscosa (strain TUFC12733) TaxID=1330018 RepID=A0A167NIL0_CALVF|nr:hypothetical protein CALVIDRAFT_59756 [Calocera viscosa TUFC12733]